MEQLFTEEQGIAHREKSGIEGYASGNQQQE